MGSAVVDFVSMSSFVVMDLVVGIGSPKVDSVSMSSFVLTESIVVVIGLIISRINT